MQRELEHRTGRVWVPVYATTSYVLFVVSLGWAVAFLANVTRVPAVDGGRTGGWIVAVLVDSAPLLLFAVQHTVMARQGWKRRLARVLPPAAERATFVLASSLLLIATFALWRPLPATVWHVRRAPWTQLIWVGYALGWAIALASTFVMDHLEFLGLRQAYAYARGRRAPEPAFTERWFYRFVRHPLMVGLIVAFWSTPHMTAGHLLFALAGTGYIAVGVRFEERDLARELGADYADYARRVPGFVPRLPARCPAAATATADPLGRR